MTAKIVNIQDIEIQVALDQLIGASTRLITGSNLAVGTTLETIWEQKGRLTYPTSAVAMTVSSSSVNDVNTTGTGAWTVLVRGLDANYNEVEQTVNLNGQTAVTLPTNLIRVYFAKVVTGADADATNDGDIYVGVGTVTTGVPATVYTKIIVGDAQSHQAFITVPANRKMIIHKLVGGAGKSSNNGTLSLWVRPFGEVFKNLGHTLLKEDRLVVPFAISFEEKTDIEFRAVSDASTVDVDVSFRIFLKEV